MYSFSYLEPTVVPCPVLTVASWPAYSFLRRKIKWPVILISLRIFQFVLIHIVKDFSIVSETEVDVFLEFPCFLIDSINVGNLISGSPASLKPNLHISLHILLKPNLKDFEHYFAGVWDECNCMVVWTFFGIAFLWDWNENWPFPVLWPLLSFSNLLAYWV